VSVALERTRRAGRRIDGRVADVGEVRRQGKGCKHKQTPAVRERRRRKGCTDGDGGSEAAPAHRHGFGASYVSSAKATAPASTWPLVASRRRRHHHHRSPSLPTCTAQPHHPVHPYNGDAASCGPAIGRRDAILGLFSSCNAHLCLDGSAGERGCRREQGHAQHAGALDIQPSSY
jgi:hypothetical protein